MPFASHRRRHVVERGRCAQRYRRPTRLSDKINWFAGVLLEGTSLRPDDDASAEIYGHEITAREIVHGTSTAVPDAGRRLIDVLQKKAARNRSTAAR